MAAGRLALMLAAAAALGSCAPRYTPVVMLHGWCTYDQEIVQIVLETAAGETLLAKEFNRYFPERALRLQVSGGAQVSCAVGPNRHATSCTLLDEWPPDHGFAEASLKLPKVLKLPTGGQNLMLRLDFHIIRPRIQHCS